MCLTVPMKIEEIDGNRARCTAMGEERWADLTLIDPSALGPGDYVTIQFGFVQRTVPEAEALEAHALFREILDKLDDTP